MHEILKLGHHIVDLQKLKDRCPHLRNKPNQCYNLNDVQVIHRQDCYEIHNPIESMKWECKNASWAVSLKIEGALSGSLPSKQAATLATTATSMAEDTLSSELSKRWDMDMEFYSSNSDVTVHSKDEQKTIKTVEQTTRISVEWYEVGLLCWEKNLSHPITSTLLWENSCP